MIEALHLIDFKSFRDVTVPFGPLTLIVGTNAAGKSNLRDALRFMQGIGLEFSFADIVNGRYLHGGEARWHGIRGGMREIPFHGQSKLSLCCSARVDVSRGPARRERRVQHWLEIDFSDERVGPRVMSEGVHRMDGPHIFASSKMPGDPVVSIQSRPDAAEPGRHYTISTGHAAAVQFIVQSGLPALDRRLVSSYLDLLKGIRFLDLDPETMRLPSALSLTTLGPRGENLSSVLQALCRDDQRKAVLLDWLQALTPLDVTDFAFETDFAGRVMVFLVESDGSRTSAYSASDGTLRFLAMVAALLSADSGRIYVIEELDNGIHPTRLHLLLELIERACHEQGIQVIGTTHNPAMLAFLSDEAREAALLVHRTPGENGSKVIRLMDLPDIERVLEKENLGELLTAGWLDDAAFFAAGDDEDDE